MERMGNNQRRRECLVQFARWRYTGGKVCRLWLHLVINWKIVAYSDPFAPTLTVTIQ